MSAVGLFCELLDAGEVEEARAEMQPRCCRDAADMLPEMLPRCCRDAAEMSAALWGERGAWERRVRERRRHCHAPPPHPSPASLQIVLVGFDGFKPGQPKHYFENFEPWHERVLGWFIEDLLKQSNHDPRSEQATPPPAAGSWAGRGPSVAPRPRL